MIVHLDKTNGREKNIVKQNPIKNKPCNIEIILVLISGRTDGRTVPLFVPIFACRGGPGSAAPAVRRGPPRSSQKLINFFSLLERTFHENISCGGVAKCFQEVAKCFQVVAKCFQVQVFEHIINF